LVALTEGLVYPRKDIWNGRSRKAPETPPMEVKKEMTNATKGGIHNATSIPAVWKNMEPPLYMKQIAKCHENLHVGM
jgi:hypothetical protein